MSHIPHIIEGDLPNARLIDSQGLFIGNHHYPIPDAVDALLAMS